MSHIKATTQRVLKQLSHDKRTIALVLIVPCGLLVILKFVYNKSNSSEFNQVAPMLLAIFPLILMFVVTSVTTLRERQSGTLERQLTMPISKAALVGGYAIAFTLVAIAQAALATLTVTVALGVKVSAGVIPILIIAALSGFLGNALGLLASAFAKSEFQAVQFLPAIIFPQLLTCGLFVPRGQMARPLQIFADIAPLTYCVDAMVRVSSVNHWSSNLIKDTVIIFGASLLALGLAATTIKRSVKI